MVKVFVILPAVKRHYIEPFPGFPYESLIKIGSLQVSTDLIQPFLSGYRRELLK